MSVDEIKTKVMQTATNSIVDRLLRNSGLEDMINHPKKYKMEVTFEDDGATIKVKKRRDSK